MGTNIDLAQPGMLTGRTVIGADGEKLGKIDDVLTDNMGRAEYIEVKSGWFGTKRHVIPASSIGMGDGDDLTVPYTKDQLQNAPTFDEGEHVDYDAEQQLGRHYGTEVRDWDDTRDRWTEGEDLSRGPTPETRHPGGGLDDASDLTQGPTPTTRARMRATDDDPASGQPATDARTREGGDMDMDARGTGMADAPPVGDDLSGPETDNAMTRSEEELQVGLERREAGRVRLRKWVETEQQTRTVPVQHEEVRISREPVTDANMGRAMDGPAISEEEHEITLTRDEPVASVEAHPVERVRLDKESVTEQQEVSGEVRKERIEVEGDQGLLGDQR
jgi:uncharacterized protein (TIGR02271 family)